MCRSRPVVSVFIFLLALPCCVLAANNRFVTPPYYAVGRGPIGIASADFNRDGKPDLVVANQTGESISVLLNNGDGTLQPPVNYITSPDLNPAAVAVGDFNGDGIKDIAIAGDGCCGGQINIFLGNGDGTFQGAVSYKTASLDPHSLAAVDLNGDGQLDLVVNNASGAGGGPDAVVTVLLGKGDGTFGSAIVTSLTNLESTTGSMVVGDFNKDSRMDVAVLDRGTVSILLGKGNGTFLTPAYSPLSISSALAGGDLNGDGIFDLVVGNLDGSISVLAGNGDGTFQTPTITPGVATVTAILVTDLNGDGKLDVITEGINTVSAFLGDGKGNLNLPSSFIVGSGPSENGGLAAVDLDGDGHMDVAVTNWVDVSMTVLFGNGDGTLRSPGVAPNPAGPMITGDFNNDGKLDAVAVVASLNEISFFAGNGNGTLQNAVAVPVGRFPISITVADFNGDGNLDVATANTTTISVVFGNGNGTFQKPVSYGSSSNVGSPSTFISAGDFNGDGKSDLAIVTRPVGSPAVIAIMLNKGDGTFLPATQYAVHGFPQSLTFGDFNGDGKIDIAATTVKVPFPVAVLLGNGDGTFQNAVDYSTLGAACDGIVAADFNGDGKQDLALGCGGLGIFPGNGDGTFGTVNYQPTGLALTLIAGDFDGNGTVDLTESGFDLGIFDGIGDGTFSFVNYGVTAKTDAVGDFNGDHAPDVAIFNGVGVTVLLNTGGTSDGLSSSVNPSKNQQAVKFAATVAGSVPGVSVAPTGTVTFFDAKFKLGTVALRNGSAFLSTTKLAPGIHKIAAVYSGDENFNPNVSAVLLQRVLPN
jgi:hypothetical protein